MFENNHLNAFASNSGNSSKVGRLILILTVAITISLSATAQQNSILPKPGKVEFSTGVFPVPDKFIVYQKEGKSTASYLTKELKERFKSNTARSLSAGKATIRLINNATDSKSESYKLTVDSKQLTIEANSETGLFYGVQSLLQLIRNSRHTDKAIACQVVTDSPRFGWRAFMLDESRYFKGEKEVIRLLDVMAELKMNIFHWHLTDDQGWRIEIKKYPLLTTISSKRKDTQKIGRAHV